MHKVRQIPIHRTLSIPQPHPTTGAAFLYTKKLPQLIEAGIVFLVCVWYNEGDNKSKFERIVDGGIIDD